MLLRNYIYIIFYLFPLCSIGQFYITGRVTDEQHKPLSRVKMRLSGSSLIYQSGSDGEFGIPSIKRSDSVLCYLQGYDTLKAMITAPGYNFIVMTPSSFSAKENSRHLSSLTNNLLKDPAYMQYAFGETYHNMIENGFVGTAQYPVTGFSLNVNKASYSNIRRFISSSSVVPADAVRIEEMLNYFSFDISEPADNKNLFNIHSWLSSCPWDNKNALLFVNVKSKKIDIEKVPPSNLVFLIDNSGSMDRPNRLPLLKTAFKMLVNNLRNSDTITIVTYGGNASLTLQPTGGSEKQKIIEAIEELSPAGATPGSSGLRLAYQMAKKSYIKNGNNRVILATDGDFNVGQVNEQDLENLIVHYRNSGIFLTCLGVGMGNYKDSKLEVLARFGNGNFAYLDKELEAEKVLVKEFTQTLVTIAKDAFLHINFDKHWVDQYRLIGFDNEQEAASDSSSTIEGGEIGGGHSLIAIFEIIPGIKWNPNLALPASIGQIQFQYKLPNQEKQSWLYKEVRWNYKPFTYIDKQLQFATAVAMFGQLLKQSKFALAYSFENVLSITASAVDPKDFLQQEFLKLVQTAKKIYEKKKKRKR